jgi:hypothetical protein
MPANLNLSHEHKLKPTVVTFPTEKLDRSIKQLTVLMLNDNLE